ncbi:LWR-salt protein [Halosegnis sp.]|uniref:LWR-salt protein n=1 Tax=Halosegnis sp. TaxID=2864959 RepID=UPI0035D5092D
MYHYRPIGSRRYSASAPPPGKDGWLFFRDNCWRGEANDPTHLRQRAEKTLGVTVESIEFRELACDRDYHEQLKSAIAADLNRFRAEDATTALRNYLGNSIRITDDSQANTS